MLFIVRKFTKVNAPVTPAIMIGLRQISINLFIATSVNATTTSQSEKPIGTHVELLFR